MCGHWNLTLLPFDYDCLKAIVENSRCTMEKLWRLPRDFLRANLILQNRGGAALEVLQLRVCPKKIPREPSHWAAEQCIHQRDSPEGTVFPHCTAPRIFNGYSGFQNHEVHFLADCPQKVSIKSFHKRCPQKVFTKSAHKKCSQKVPIKSISVYF